MTNVCFCYDCIGPAAHSPGPVVRHRSLFVRYVSVQVGQAVDSRYHQMAGPILDDRMSG